MVQNALVTTADVVFCFQIRPGTDSSNVINAGDARLVGSADVVKAQGKGFYGAKMNPGETAEIQILGTTYTVRYNDKDEAESTDDDNMPITAWKAPGDINKLMGQQRRLQLLGYYQGLVDGRNGRNTEHAILGFQADHNLRTDAIVGPKSRNKLTEVIDNKNKSGTAYIVRRTLIRFTRASSKDLPAKFSGIPDSMAPDLDDRGFIKVKSYGLDLNGPVLTMKRGSNCRIKVVREYIDPKAPLVACSSDENVVRVSTPNLPEGRFMIMELEAQTLLTPDPKTATISVNYKDGGKEIQIGSLEVIVMPTITRLVRPVWVTINGTAPGTADDKKNYKQAFYVCNAIWKHYGVYFHFLGWKEKTVIGMNAAGVLSKVGGSSRTEFRKVSNANNDDGGATEEDKINLYIVRDLQGAYGTTYDALDFNWPNGIALKKNNTWTMTGIDLAHELGHFIGLANCLPPNSCVHAEDDPDKDHKKKDIWSIRRLMYGGWPTVDRPGQPWANDVGYGHGQYGCMVSVRDLPQEKPDNELKNGRKHMKSAKLYKK
ncbi:MAG: peptidoglycan-binding protein [Methanosarcinaceae archaeon]|nr:peptidoglycan-binding protein [Methanosarcinaceae archaeon]